MLFKKIHKGRKQAPFVFTVQKLVELKDFFNSLISLKASRKTLSRIPQGGLVHMKQLWRLQSCVRIRRSTYQE